MEPQFIKLDNGIAVTYVFDTKSRFVINGEGGVCMVLPGTSFKIDYLVLSGPSRGNLVGFQKAGARAPAEVLPIDTDAFHFNVSSAPKRVQLSMVKPGALAFNADGAFIVANFYGGNGALGTVDLKRLECEPVYDRTALVFEHWRLIGTKEGKPVFHLEIDVEDDNKSQ